MKHTPSRWITRIGLGILAVVAALGVILYLLNPEVAVLVALILLHPLLSNTHPPPILSGVGTPGTWRSFDENNREVTAALQQKFPIGTNEDSVRATLLKQGFKPPPPAPGDCAPQGAPPPVGRILYRCPTYDPDRILQYQWSNFPCGFTVTVNWTTGDHGDIAQIRGDYSSGCL
jgi:hypothetical protein